MKPPPRFTQAFGLALIIVGYFLASFAFRGVSRNDPDRFYHLALARQTTHGLVRTLPQAADLEWATSFPDKNFLFTAITALAYRFGGDAAVLALIPILGILFLGLLNWRLIESGLAVLPAAFVTLSLLLIPDEANRIMLLRPHLLALVCFLVLLVGLLKKNPWLAAFGAGIFALSYHALYVPFATVAVFYVTGRGEEKEVRPPALYALAGLLLGVAVNPYFPKNLGMMFTTLSIAFNWNGLKSSIRPLENVRLPWPAFFFEYGPLLLILLVSIWLYLAHRRTPRSSRNGLFLLVLGLLFWGLSAITRRAAEYAIPITLLLVGLVVSEAKERRFFAPAMIGILLLLQLPMAVTFYGRERQPMDLPLYALEAMKEIPKESGNKVFNCEWHNSPYVLYARPDLKFIDISDPSLLFDAHPQLYLLREKVRKGEVADLYETIQTAFHSDLVLCEKRSVVRAMELDSRFRRLYPLEFNDRELATWKPFLYALKTPSRHQP